MWWRVLETGVEWRRVWNGKVCGIGRSLEQGGVWNRVGCGIGKGGEWEGVWNGEGLGGEGNG